MIDLQQQLAARTAELLAMTAARDEVCDLADEHIPENGHDVYRARIAELRAIGKVTP